MPRGAGTGLSGGTIACADAIVVSTARMREILSIDPIARVAVVEPGVPNLAVTAAAREQGLFFAPDPASQRISTIGGNVATNAGGPHALRYGSMANHVLGVELVLPTGECVRFGGEVVDLPGYDCVPFIVGSEGTVGIVTKVWLRLLPLPEDVRTFVAVFADIEHGARAASAIIASGVVPAAMEMLDQVTIGALNAAFEVHLPADAGSLLLVEVEGASRGDGGLGGRDRPHPAKERRDRRAVRGNRRRARASVEGTQARIRGASAEPGESRVGRFSLPPGTYRLWCSLPQHEEWGMSVNLEVRAG